ncbi:LytTR family DNA-binding domain-containing protein [Rhizomicrobium palustre]
MEQQRLKAFRVLLVDDEAPARRRLHDLLSDDPEISTISEAENGLAAVAAIESEKPDIIFLDVQMPEVDGFGVIDAIGSDLMPLTIFVTAYDQYALKAFEADAVDYLLKPFGDKRFHQAVARAKARLRNSDCKSIGPNVMGLVSKREASGVLWDWLVIKTGGVTKLLMASEIDWIEAAGVYVNLHFQGKECVYRSSLAAVTKRLDPMRFVRIHRSSVVNIRAITHLEPISHGEFEVLLRDGTRLTLSRNFRAEVEKRLGQSL